MKRQQEPEWSSLGTGATVGCEGKRGRLLRSWRRAKLVAAGETDQQNSSIFGSMEEDPVPGLSGHQKP